MIVVIVQEWPQGNRERAVDLGTLHIANVGGSAEYGRYEVTLRKGEPTPWRVLASGQCEHRRTRPVWALLVQALRALGFERP
jgi:hypothetical protein